MTNQPGSFARLWVAHFVSTLLVCAGAVVLVPALAPHAPQISTLSIGGDAITADEARPALTRGALAPETPDSTDNDDDDDGDELPGGSMVLPAQAVDVASVVVEFLPHAAAPVVRSRPVDSHSLRAPPR